MIILYSALQQDYFMWVPMRAREQIKSTFLSGKPEKEESSLVYFHRLAGIQSMSYPRTQNLS